jgi:hypothetical protein
MIRHRPHFIDGGLCAMQSDLMGKKKAKSTVSISRQTMTISKGDKSIKTDLCCFCSNQKDLTGVTKCEHYDLYIGKRCPCFIKYPDQANRLEELFLIRRNEENGE